MAKHPSAFADFIENELNLDGVATDSRPRRKRPPASARREPIVLRAPAPTNARLNGRFRVACVLILLLYLLVELAPATSREPSGLRGGQALTLSDLEASADTAR